MQMSTLKRAEEIARNDRLTRFLLSGKVSVAPRQRGMTERAK
jgi:hypothetical protein